MSDDDPCDITVNDIEHEVWRGRRHPDLAHAFLARALCRAAAECTHECGTIEATLGAYAHTVRSFLRVEASTRARRSEQERDAAIARAERAERLCVALVDTLGHSCALPDGRTMFAASCHYMQSDWREQVEAMRAMVKP